LGKVAGAPSQKHPRSAVHRDHPVAVAEGRRLRARSRRTFELAPDNLFKGVRVRAAENAVEVGKIPPRQQPCRDQGQRLQGLRRAAGRGNGACDLTLARHQDPNRLNLILGADNTVVETSWE
jgi:hypothetical protein